MSSSNRKYIYREMHWVYHYLKSLQQGVDTHVQTFYLAPDHSERVAAKGHLLERQRPKAGYPHRDTEHLLLPVEEELRNWTGCR